MKQRFTNFSVVILIVILSLFTTNAMGQQVIGSFPTMDGGFEGQAASGALTSQSIATGVQTTVWTTSSSNLATFQTTSPRTGGKYVTVNFTGSTKRLQSPTAADGAIVGGTGNYTIQFWYRTGTTAPGGGNNQAAASTDGTSPTSAMSYTTFTTTATNGVWTKLSSTINSASSTSSPKYGYLCAYRTATAMAAAMDIDDVCMYAGALDVTAPDAPTAPTAPTSSPSQIVVSWTAPSTGVDGGGYMVVRSDADPTAVPNVNGIYAIGNAVNDGVGTSGTVVYLGTDPTYTDLGLPASTTYYYRIYTVDKAFNYSAAAAVIGKTDVATGISQTQIAGVTFDGKVIHNTPNLDLQVFEATGRLVASSNNDIDMSSKAKGIYLVKSNAGTLKIAIR